MTLSALSAISYATTTDSYSFGPFAKSHITATPIPDRAGRTTKAVKYTLRVDDIVYTDSSSDGYSDITNRMRRVKRILTTHCGHLTYSGRGFGIEDLDELNVNDPSEPNGMKDLMYGPKPEIIEFYPLGGVDAQAAKIAWQVTTVLPECAGAKYERKPMDFSYEVDYRIDYGYTVRTISGQLEIPATRISNARVASDAADLYWDTVVAAIPMLPGFRRSTSRKNSLDKRVLSFTITDKEETPTAFMEGMEDWDADQEISSVFMRDGFRMWSSTVSANFRVQRDRNKRLAWDRFTLILASRIRNKAKSNKPNYLPVSTRVRDRLNNQEVSFQHSWTYASHIGNFLADSSMFAITIPNGGVGWEQWKDGAVGAARARGYAGLAYKPEYDAIIDLCSPTTIKQAPPEAQEPLPKRPPKRDDGGGRVGDGLPKFGNIKGDSAKAPPKDESFLAYECHLGFYGKSGIARHKPLHYAPSSLAYANETDANARTRFQQGSTPADVFQTIGPATCKVVLSGSAIRAGYAVVPPKLVSVGGVAAVLADEQFSNADIGNAGGIPIFGGSWEITYLLASVPGGAIEVPKNLLTDAIADGGEAERV